MINNLEEKCTQVGKPINNFVKVFVIPQVAAIVHSKLLASSLSFHLRMREVSF